MIERPNCDHKPEADKLLVCCYPCFDGAVRKNLLDNADTRIVVRYTSSLEKQIAVLRDQVQQLEADLHDCKSAPGITFLRCECGRLRSKGHLCRGCSRV